MEIYEDYHDGSTHWHPGQDRHTEPNQQNKIYKKIEEEVEKELEDTKLSIRQNTGAGIYPSFNVIDEGNKSYLHVSLYKQYGKWRIKIKTYEQGQEFFQEKFRPLLEEL